VIAEQEWSKVEQRKARIAAQSERNATRAAELIAEKLEKENVPLATLVPVFGVSVDKFVALRGDPAMVARIDHVHSGNIFQAYAELCDAIRARAKAKADQPTSSQLALPNGGAGSDS
jgi:hypothetical protein